MVHRRLAFREPQPAGRRGGAHERRWVGMVDGDRRGVGVRAGEGGGADAVMRECRPTPSHAQGSPCRDGRGVCLSWRTGTEFTAAEGAHGTGDDLSTAPGRLAGAARVFCSPARMDPTDDPYEAMAPAFFAATVGVDMAPLHARFVAGLTPGAHVLDAGCGSGRDARAFSGMGFRVTAFDASAALARLASAHCGFEVAHRRFEDVEESGVYDGIWCCASLLHVPRVDLPRTLSRLWRALRPGGRLYASFKLGTGDRIEGERHFTDADEQQVRAWFGVLPNVRALDVWLSDDRRPDRPQEWINVLVHQTPFRRVVTGGDDDPFLPHLSQAIGRATHADLAVAFVKVTGLRLLMPDLETLVDEASPGRLRILTSDYLDVTDPDALRLLLLLRDRGAQVRVHAASRGDGGFHLKAYLFAQLAGERLVAGTGFIGSSNISRQALQRGLEWNYRIVHPGDSGFVEARERFEALFRHPATVTLDDAWIEAYERRRRLPARELAPGSHEQDPAPAPTAVQRDALEALSTTREDGYRRGLVVLATGLGKTWLAAFDAVAAGARRILFVAHREEILAQAAATFLRVAPGRRVGFWSGGVRDEAVEVLCASVQTLSRAEHLARFDPRHFDYVVVDEFHHAAASTYRRLLAHFEPAFMLGLTATPDRTDQSDILSLCDDNLVFSCHVFDGIEAGLLSPFHYFGIRDVSVDYREIPWRNGGFDLEHLTAKLATRARARHVLGEWRRRALRRTLAFCVSTRHADFMAEQFAAAGVPAIAVYAGSDVGRTQALELLRDGRVQVVFSVDLFNEGVDLPAIDTVMMLRPTSSRVLFLQQFGRGLRRCDGKSHLVVLDFIGNHRSFLGTPQALFGAEPTYTALAAFARRVEQGTLELPAGCFVNYDLALVDLLKSLDSGGPRQDYQSLRDVLGRRPTLTEFWRSGSSVAAMRRHCGDWFGLVRAMGDLTEPESDVAVRWAELLREVEVAAMTRSFKMVLLEALLELDGFSASVPLDRLAHRSRAVIERRRHLLADLSPALRDADGSSSAWQRHWLDNPVRAWTGGNRAGTARVFFRVSEGAFGLAAAVATSDRAVLCALVQELVDQRLAAYEVRIDRSADGDNVVPFPTRRAEVVQLPYFPDLRIACGHFRTASTEALTHRHVPARYGPLDPARHFLAHATGHSMDGGKHPVRDGDLLLLELITPSRAGSITGQVVAIERGDPSTGDSQYLLRVVTKAPDGSYVLKAQNEAYADLPASDDMRTLARLQAIVDPLDLVIGQAFSREGVAELFGQTFNPGSWNVGHVTVPGREAHVLLVTLSKQGKAEEHRYVDHWIDDHRFHWQSQNATTPQSKRGREVIEHVARGISIHLFVRDAKLAAGKAAPFTYHGRVRYVSHEGSGPMSVVFALGT